MIILAFAAELTDAISDEVLNNVVMARIRQSLDQGINSNELFSTTAAGRLPVLAGDERQTTGLPRQCRQRPETSAGD